MNFSQMVWTAQVFGFVGFEVHFDDVVRRRTAFKEVFLEEIKQKKTLAATPYTSKDFYESVMLGLDKSVGQGRSGYFNLIDGTGKFPEAMI